MPVHLPAPDGVLLRNREQPRGQLVRHVDKFGVKAADRVRVAGVLGGVGL
ncbi:hypothetical protein [Streptomyces sp. NPDC004296]